VNRSSWSLLSFVRSLPVYIVFLWQCSPSGCLASTFVRLCLFCFLAQSGGTVWVLLAHALNIGQILCTVDNSHQGANLRAIHCHVRVDTCGMHAVHQCCRHGSECAEVKFGEKVVKNDQSQQSVHTPNESKAGAWPVC
jgi:hypothetical protein